MRLVHMCLYTLCLRRPETTGSLEADFTGSIEPPHGGTGNKTVILCKGVLTTKPSSQASFYILSHRVWTNASGYVQARGTFAAFGSLYHVGPQDWMQDTCRQVPLPTEPPYQLWVLFTSFITQQNIPSSSCTFLVPGMEPVVSPRSILSSRIQGNQINLSSRWRVNQCLV